MRRKRISAKHPNKDIESHKRIRTSLTGLQKKQICQIKLNNHFLLTQKLLNRLVVCVHLLFTPTLYAKGALLNRLVVAVIQRSSLCTLMFLEQKRDDDIEVCRDDLLLMRRLLRDIEKEKINHMKQGQLNWFGNNNKPYLSHKSCGYTVSHMCNNFIS